MHTAREVMTGLHLLSTCDSQDLAQYLGMQRRMLPTSAWRRSHCGEGDRQERDLMTMCDRGAQGVVRMNIEQTQL